MLCQVASAARRLVATHPLTRSVRVPRSRALARTKPRNIDQFPALTYRNRNQKSPRNQRSGVGRQRISRSEWIQMGSRGAGNRRINRRLRTWMMNKGVPEIETWKKDLKRSRKSARRRVLSQSRQRLIPDVSDTFLHVWRIDELSVVSTVSPHPTAACSTEGRQTKSRC